LCACVCAGYGWLFLRVAAQPLCLLQASHAAAHAACCVPGCLRLQASLVVTPTAGCIICAVYTAFFVAFFQQPGWGLLLTHCRPVCHRHTAGGPGRLQAAAGRALTSTHVHAGLEQDAVAGCSDMKHCASWVWAYNSVLPTLLKCAQSWFVQAIWVACVAVPAAGCVVCAFIRNRGMCCVRGGATSRTHNCVHYICQILAQPFCTLACRRQLGQ
jgi:hypothetical protein